MAVNNRDEAIISVNTDMVPTISALELRTLLNDEILNSVVFRKDVIASETPIAGAVTIDYSNKDTATVMTAINLAVSFTNIENGDVKFLEITKAAANVISFVGASDMVNYKDYINSSITSICYRITNKNNIIYVESIFAGNNLLAWITTPIGQSWIASEPFSYRKNFNGNIEFKGKISGGLFGATIATLPPLFRPDSLRNIPIITYGPHIDGGNYYMQGIMNIDLNGNIQLFKSREAVTVTFIRVDSIMMI